MDRAEKLTQTFMADAGTELAVTAAEFSPVSYISLPSPSLTTPSGVTLLIMTQRTLPLDPGYNKNSLATLQQSTAAILGVVASFSIVKI